MIELSIQKDINNRDLWLEWVMAGLGLDKLWVNCDYSSGFQPCTGVAKSKGDLTYPDMILKVEVLYIVVIGRMDLSLLTIVICHYVAVSNPVTKSFAFF